MVFLMTNHEKQLREAAMKLALHFPFSTAELLLVLRHIETLVMRSTVLGNVYNYESMKYAMHPVIGALINKQLLRHPDVDVNISVACCICAVIRTVVGYEPYNNEQVKDFFELVVITLEKLSSVSSGCYSKMARVLEQLSGGKFSVLMYDLQLDGLIVRLFTQFLVVADFNSAAVVLMMKKIMAMIIAMENKPLNSEIVKLLVRCVRKENQDPSSRRLGGDILKNCAAKLKPYLPDRMVNEFHNFLGESISLTTDMNNLKKAATHKRKLDFLAGGSNMVHPIRRCQDANSHTVNLLRDYMEHDMPNTLASPQFDTVSVQGYKVKKVNASILEAIFKKHGDIAAYCVFKIASVREPILEAVCDVARKIQTNDVTTIISEMPEIESIVSAAETNKIDVSWLQTHLEAIRKSYEAEEKATMLMELQTNTSLVERAARSDLKERHTKLVAAQNEFAEAERRAEVLKVVKKKLNKDVLESKAEKELLAPKPVI